MSVRLRSDQACLNGPDCNPAFPNRPRPARHGGLCVQCYMAAAPAVRATADLLDKLDAERVRAHLELLADALQPTEPIDTAGVAQACALEDLWDLPEYRPEYRRAA